MDPDKAEKIALAKKKLKEYQERTKKDKSTTPSDTPIPPPEASPKPTPEPELQPSQPLSSLESLNQLSARISSLVSERESAVNDGIVRDLETRNQELAASLHAEKLRNEELGVTVRDKNSQIDQLKIEIDKLRVENSTKLTMEVGPLQEQLNSHLQTIGVLVGEKAELQAYLKEYQNAVQEKRTENEELQTRLRASRFRVSELERDVKKHQSGGSVSDSAELNRLQVEIEQLRTQNEELQEQVNELKQKVALKSTETSELRTQLDTKNAELSMAQLKIEQLAGGDSLESDSRLESLTQQNLAKDLQITQLQKMIEQLGAERDQSNAQYQTYMLQLNREMAKMGERESALVKREASLVKHVGELELQIQQQMSKQKASPPASPEVVPNIEKEAQLSGEIDELRTKVNEVQRNLDSTMANLEVKSKECADLRRQLDEKSDQLTAMELTIERLQVDKPDTGKLIAELESQKVGASRAVVQNLELKNQLEEMQRAFVQISNDKLELTDKLQSEQHLCREMRHVYSEMETDLASTKERLALKDEEMNRMAHEATELEEKVLQCEQELDHLRHYAATGDSGAFLQSELQQARATVDNLSARIAELEAVKVHAGRVETPEESTDELSTIEEGQNAAEAEEMAKEIDILRTEKEELLKIIADFRTKVIQPSTPAKMVASEVQTVPLEPRENGGEAPEVPRNDVPESLNPQEALERLQEKFTRTMEEVETLTEEKDRLEHLVLRLQFETETIGEYITLYQTQRRQLKQKDLERDRELQQLALDRELLKAKLLELNELIEQLLVEKRRLVRAQSQEPVTNGTSEEESVVSNGESEVQNGQNVVTESEGMEGSKLNTQETAKKILALLTDIQKVNHSHELGGVDKCACCQGELEQV